MSKSIIEHMKKRLQAIKDDLNWAKKHYTHLENESYFLSEAAFLEKWLTFAQEENYIHIARILTLIDEYWNYYPDLRLGQIIVNMCPLNKDIFYVEDNEIIKQLTIQLDRIRKTKL